MANFGEQPSSSRREDFDQAEKGEADLKDQISKATASGDFERVSALAQEAAGFKANKEKIKGLDQWDAEEENAKRDLLRGETEVGENGRTMYDEAKEEDAAREERKAELVEQARAQTAADELAAAEVLKGIQGVEEEGSGPVVSENNLEAKEGLPAEVQGVIKKMIEAGYYTEELPKLKSGEIPSVDLATRMISSVFYGARLGDGSPHSSFKIGEFEALVKNLSFDKGRVKKELMKDIMESIILRDGDAKLMEIANIDPKSFHDEAVKELPSLLHLVVGDRGEIRVSKNVSDWKETFGISDEEYADALHSCWKSHPNQISDKHLIELGFIKMKNGQSQGWAWEGEK
jgi:hypothetical protein